MSDTDLAPTRRALVVKAAGALAAGSLAPMSAAASPGDAALLALGRQLEVAWAHERSTTNDATVSDEAFDQIVDRVSVIVDEINEQTATTIDGLVVKARACSWCHSGDPFEDHTLNDQATTDVQLASSILRDLLAIDGRPASTS